MKIAFFGMGGVGGYLAAQMANYYKNSEAMEFYFIARGSHLDAIKEHGLTLQVASQQPITVHPKLATDDTAQCPVMDYVIYSTKSYSIESNIEQLKNLCNERTVLIPFMNGVDGQPKLKNALSDTMVADGCVYIFSRIERPGEILCTSASAQFFVGDEGQNQSVQKFCELAKSSGIDMSYVENIDDIVWKKFIRISVFGTVTTHHNINNLQLKSNPSYVEELRALSDEFCDVAYAMGKLTEYSKDRLFQDNMKMVNNSADSSTSSMQRDYWAGKLSELDSLTGYVTKMGRVYGVETPIYDKAYSDLKK